MYPLRQSSYTCQNDIEKAYLVYNGRIVAFQVTGPGSIPGIRIVLRFTFSFSCAFSCFHVRMIYDDNNKLTTNNIQIEKEKQDKWI
jgi:hypothetical protein